MYLILFGAPGVGKGTQAQRICTEYKVPQISTGEMLRAAINNGSELGKKAKALMEKGELVPDNVILKIIEERIVQPDCAKGFILDGFPRTIRQAEEFSLLTQKHNIPKFKCIEISVPDDIILERLMARKRDDDTTETILHRLEVYKERTSPVKEYYKQTKQFFSIDGNKSVDDVYNGIKNLVIN